MKLVESPGHPVVIDGLKGYLADPDPGHGIVIFAHGSGSGRDSPRNQFVARGLQETGLGTLLLDLLSEGEEGDRHNVFDIKLLAGRLLAATHWLHDQTKAAPIGYFGSSTGAAAAFAAAANSPVPIRAIVSRGGRPDLAGAALKSATMPSLLIVGGEDTLVLDLNREALDTIPGRKRLVEVAGAGHLFEEPGALERVVGLASDWFEQYLRVGDVS